MKKLFIICLCIFSVLLYVYFLERVIVNLLLDYVICVVYYLFMVKGFEVSDFDSF